MISLKRIAVNVGANYFGVFFTVGIAFVLTPLMVRCLGSSEYGVWVILNTVVFYVGFLDLGLYNALVKYIAEYLGREKYDDLNKVVRASITIYFVTGLSSLALCLFFSNVIAGVFNIPPHLAGIARLAMPLLGLKLLIVFVSTPLKGIFEGHQRYDIMNGVAVIFRILNAAATVVLVFSGFGIIALIVTGIVTACTELLCNVFLVKRLYPGISFRWGPLDKKTLKTLLHFSFWSLLYNLAFEGGVELEKLVIPILLSAAYATHYAIALTIASVLFFATTPVVQVFFPRASELNSADDKRQLRQLLIYGSKYTTAIALPIFTSLFILGEPIIARLFGREYVEITVPVLKYTLACYLTTNLFFTAITILTGLGKLKYLFSFMLTGALRAKERLKILLPVVFFVIFILLYMTFHSISESLVLMLAVLYAMTGGVILQYLLGYNFSVAVWIGYIALYGIAVETGVVMIIYLHEALDRRLKQGPVSSRDIRDATVEGSVLRLRPKLMTVGTTLIGLIPIMWSSGVGADVMKPIAAPIIGGVVTSTIHVLIITPVIFAMVKERALKRGRLQAPDTNH